MADGVDYVSDALGTTFIGQWSGAETNALGVAGSIAFGLTGLDFYKDLGDLGHDLYHWDWTWSHARGTAFNAVALLPGIGVVKNLKGLKYLDEAADVAKEIKVGANTLDALGDGAKTASRIPFPTKAGGTGAAYSEMTGQGLYILRSRTTGQIEYIGRGDAPSRLLDHAMPGSDKQHLVGEILFNNNLTAAQAQSLENELMHILGGPKSINPGTPLLNKVQGIGERNPNFLNLEFAADDELVIEALKRAGLLGT
jgi:hypothetical protein